MRQTVNSGNKLSSVFDIVLLDDINWGSMPPFYA